MIISFTERFQFHTRLQRECSCPPTCHISRVMCQMSCVTGHFLFFFFFDNLVKLNGGGSVINGAYPVYLIFFLEFSEMATLVFSLSMQRQLFDLPFSHLSKHVLKVWWSFFNKNQEKPECGGFLSYNLLVSPKISQRSLMINSKSTRRTRTNTTLR